MTHPMFACVNASQSILAGVLKTMSSERWVASGYAAQGNFPGRYEATLSSYYRRNAENSGGVMIVLVSFGGKQPDPYGLGTREDKLTVIFQLCNHAAEIKFTYELITKRWLIKYCLAPGNEELFGELAAHLKIAPRHHDSDAGEKTCKVVLETEIFGQLAVASKYTYDRCG